MSDIVIGSIYLPDFDTDIATIFIKEFFGQSTEYINPVLSRKSRHSVCESVAGLYILARFMEADGIRGVLSRSPESKPLLTGGAVFSVSHKNDFSVCAYSRNAVSIGTDIEDTISDGRAAALAQRFLSEDERTAVMSSLNTGKEFLRIWTRKEAFGKFTGTGLSGRIDLIPTSDSDALKRGVRFMSYQVENYMVSLAYPDGITPPDNIINMNY